jgi:hypothetical protein
VEAPAGSCRSHLCYGRSAVRTTNRASRARTYIGAILKISESGVEMVANHDSPETWALTPRAAAAVALAMN